MKKIECIGKDKITKTFEYELEERSFLSHREWIFRVYPLVRKSLEFFEFSLTEIDDKTAKVAMMNHHNQPEYIAQGIPERMIEEAYEVLGIQIISSTNSEKHQKLPNEYITIGAVKVWERLVSKGKAYFNEEERVYYHKP